MGNELRGRAQPPHETTPAPPAPGPDESAPLFGRWWVWYLLVALELALVILFCGLVTGTPR